MYVLKENAKREKAYQENCQKLTEIISTGLDQVEKKSDEILNLLKTEVRHAK